MLKINLLDSVLLYLVLCTVLCN